MVKVKICGIRTVEAAKAALDAGADFLGFNFVRSSRRFIAPEKARKIIKKVKGKTQIVGVFQNAALEEVNRIADDLSLDLVQLHGNESSDFCRKVTTSVIKAFRLPAAMKQYDVVYYMIDRERRGEGEMVDFVKARQLAEKFPLFFSGGLTTDNVYEVVKTVKPFAVDVAGGVETDGEQDIEKIREFIRRAKSVSEDSENSDSQRV